METPDKARWAEVALLSTEAKLDYLLLLLQNLPGIPVGSSAYRVLRLPVTESDVEATGSYANAALKLLGQVFPHPARGCDACFVERGDSLDALVPLLQGCLPSANAAIQSEVQRWVDHLIQSAMKPFVLKKVNVGRRGQASRMELKAHSHYSFQV